MILEFMWLLNRLPIPEGWRLCEGQMVSTILEKYPNCGRSHVGQTEDALRVAREIAMLRA